MSKGLDIRIDDNFMDMAEAFEELDPKHLLNATRRAMNRTLLTLRQRSIDEIRKKLNIKPGTLRSKHIFLQRASGGGLNTLEASILFNANPIPMLEFVKGNKSPIKQKGIPVKKRRKLRVEIEKGKRFIAKKAFIQKANTIQVFKGRRGEGFKKQGIRSIGFLIEHRGIGELLVRVGQDRLAELLKRELEFQTMKMHGKLVSKI